MKNFFLRKDNKGFKKYLLGIIFLVFACYVLKQVIYPTMICKGKFEKYRVWTEDSNTSNKKVLDNENLDVIWSLVFSRGAITINDDRFPLFKELNGTNRIAKKTTSGYEGTYSIDFLQHIKYQFSYNSITRQLLVQLNGKAPHIMDFNVGRDDLKATFIGVCQQKWL